jgi:tight adherence protein C
MSDTIQLFTIFCLAATCTAIAILGLRSKSRQSIIERLESLSGPQNRQIVSTRSAATCQGTIPRAVELLNPVAGAARQRLQTQLIQAGLYGPRAITLYLGAKLVLMFAPIAVGLALGLMQIAPVGRGILVGSLASGLGLVLPGLWLRRRKSARQLMIRRAIPEFLDVIVICLDAGLSFQAALQRVQVELATAFPLFSFELNIVLQEVQLGMSVGEALQRFADRSNIEEVRSLAGVVVQSELYGVSLTKALHIHARALRFKRTQAAEVNGQKASVKILFPTILFIFPAIFIVILGPAMIQIYAMMAKLKN